MIHGRKPLSTGLKPELQTLCGKYDPGEPSREVGKEPDGKIIMSEPRLGDTIVDQIHLAQRAKIDCIDCLKKLIEK